MKSCNYYFVDVFAENKYEGNQLAVIISEDRLNSIEMQKIAKEMNFSETVFITSLLDFSIRIFTPETELPFAGHPILGTAHVIQNEFLKTTESKITLNLKVGKIPVFFKYKSKELIEVWMEQNQPTFGLNFRREQIAPILNLKVSDIDERFPIQEVSTGLPYIIVPLKNLNVLEKTEIELKKYYNLIENISAKSILIFCPETKNAFNDLSVRVFADYEGIPEDPATGSGNGCLVAYLIKHDYYGKKEIKIRVEQGHQVGRPSLLLLKASISGDKIKVCVGGKTFIVSKGKLF